MSTEQDTSSKEGRFFGMKTSIADMLRGNKTSKDDDEDKINIEFGDDPDVVDNKSATPLQKPDAEKPAAQPDKDAGQQAAQVDDDDDDGNNYDSIELDDDMKQHSENVQKRIKKLTWQMRKAERDRDSANALRDEAVRIAKQINQQNQQQAQLIQTGEAQLVRRIKQAAQLAADNAKREYAEAFNEGDTDKIIAAQEKLNTALNEQLQAQYYEQDYNQRRGIPQQQGQPDFQQTQQFPQQQQPQRPQTPVQKPSPQAADWTARNPWFGSTKHRDMTAIAYATHERLVKDDGIMPDTKKYYELIDAEMQKRFPEYFAKRSGGNNNQQHRPTTVVAPGSRNNGTKPRSVRLEPSQVKLAKTLGISVEQYAAQYLKENQ